MNYIIEKKVEKEKEKPPVLFMSPQPDKGSLYYKILQNKPWIDDELVWMQREKEELAKKILEEVQPRTFKIHKLKRPTQ